MSAIIEKFAAVGHFSTAQSLIIVRIPEHKYYKAKHAALDAGFEIRSIGRDVRQVKCCPGADYSPFGIQRTLLMATALEESFCGLSIPNEFQG